MPPRDNFSKQRSKRSSHKRVWSDWHYDASFGCEVRTRTTSSGGKESEYRPPQVAVPRIDSMRESEPPRETSRYDYYPTHTPQENANTGTYEPQAASTAYGYDTSTYQVSATTAPNISDDFRSLSIADSATPQSSTYVDNSREVIEPVQATDSKSRFEVIKDGRKFFKVGRVFKMMWAEPAGSNARDDSFVTTSSMGEKIFSKIRHFVVVKEQRGCCSCAPLNTYGKQGANKPGVVADDHAAVYDSNMEPPEPLPREGLIKKAFPIIVEPPGQKINPLSRINFGRIHTIEHNFKVQKVGRIPTKDIPRLKEYFIESFLGETRPLSPGPTKAKDEYQSMATPISPNTYDGQSEYGTASVPRYPSATNVGYTSGPSSTYDSTFSSDHTQPQSSVPSSNYGYSYGSSTYDYPASTYPSEAQTDSPQTSSYPSTASHYPQPQPSVRSTQDGYSSQNYNSQSQSGYPAAPLYYSQQYAAPASPYQSQYGIQAPVQTTVPTQRAYPGSYSTTNPSGQYQGYDPYGWRR